jgi:hypothetical protein
MPAKKATRTKTTTAKTTTTTTKKAVVPKVKKSLKKSVRSVQESLPLEPKRVSGEDMERWHREMCRVMGRLSVTLSRRRLPADLIDDLVNTIAPVLEEIRTFQ